MLAASCRDIQAVNWPDVVIVGLIVVLILGAMYLLVKMSKG